MQRPLILAASVCTCLVMMTGCRIADLRDDTALEDVKTIDDTSRQKAAKLLDAMLAAHGGKTAYDAHDTARVVMTDTWPSWLERTFVMPWDDSGQRLELLLDLGTENSRVTLLDGADQGRVVGIQNWATYHIKGHDEITFEADEDTWFWLPTMHYFFEAAFRIGEAQIMGYAGERTYKGKTYQGVFLTWSTAEPTMAVDQYVAWVDPDTSRLAMLEYTVRDFYRFVTGTAVYTDYTEHEGTVFPGKITIYSGDVDDDSVLHILDVEEVEPGVVDKKVLIPDPSISLGKHDKGAR